MSSSGITQDELADTEEWQRHFPNSEAIWAEAYDEGEPRRSDEPDRPALLREYRRAEGYAAQILKWYEGQLSGRGWAHSGDFGRQFLGATYRRDLAGRSEQFWIVIRNREAMTLPPRGARHPGTTFEVGYQASTAATGLAGDR